MICPWCENCFIIDEMKNLIKGPDGEWYHVICLRDKSDLENKKKRDKIEEKT